MSQIINVFRPALKRKDLENVLETMVKEQLEYGEVAKKFEEKLSDRAGCNNAVAFNSFYSTIDIVLDTLNISEGDEVILPSFAPVIYIDVLNRKKITPVLVDLDEKEYKINEESVKNAITDKTKAVFVIYHFGYTYNLEYLSNLVPYIIEDITSIIGLTDIKETTVFKNSEFAIADFSISSLITTGKGGAIFCQTRKSYSVLKNTISESEPDDYKPGYHSFMPDLNAAMGVSQNSTLNHRLKLRTKIGEIYEKSLQKSRSSFIHISEEQHRVYSTFPIIVNSSLKDSIAFFKKNKIEAVRPYNYPLHQLMKKDKKDFINTENHYLKTLLIPIHSTLKNKDVEHISKVLISMI